MTRMTKMTRMTRIARMEDERKELFVSFKKG